MQGFQRNIEATMEARAADPADEARELIDNGANLISMFQGRLSTLERAFTRAQGQVQGLKRAGAGDTETQRMFRMIVMPAMEDLVDLAKRAMEEARRVAEAK